jgi:hypothetical protein
MLVYIQAAARHLLRPHLHPAVPPRPLPALPPGGGRTLPLRQAAPAPALRPVGLQLCPGVRAAPGLWPRLP